MELGALIVEINTTLLMTIPALFVIPPFPTANIARRLESDREPAQVVLRPTSLPMVLLVSYVQA